MDALVSDRTWLGPRFSARIRAWTSSWLGHACPLLKTDETLDLIVLGPWMLSSGETMDLHGLIRNGEDGHGGGREAGRETVRGSRQKRGVRREALETPNPLPCPDPDTVPKVQCTKPPFQVPSCLGCLIPDPDPPFAARKHGFGV